MLFRFDKRDQKPNYWQCQPLGAEYQVTKPIRPPPASKLTIFLAVQDRSIGDLVTHWVSEWVRFWFQRLQSTADCRAVVDTYDLSYNWSEGWGEMLWTTRRQRQIQKQRQRRWERFSDLVTQWHTWLLLTNWGTQIMTLRDFILTVREWLWQHLQFFRCFSYMGTKSFASSHKS